MNHTTELDWYDQLTARIEALAPDLIVSDSIGRVANMAMNEHGVDPKVTDAQLRRYITRARRTVGLGA